MNKLSDKKFIIVGTGLVAVLILLFIVIFPTVKQIKTINAQIMAERSKLEELYQRGQTLRSSRDKYNETKSEVSTMKDIFIAEGEELNLITKLERIAAKNGIEQQINLNSKNSEIKDALKKMPLNLKARGSFKNLIAYLKDIETADFYFITESLSFLDAGQISNHQIQGSTPPLNTVSLDLNGYIYYYQEKI